MTYSVWNQGAGRFDYYEAPGVEAKANVGKPGHLRHRTLGSTPAQAAWPLPVGARRVGAGEQARGRIAAVGGSELGALEADGGLVKFALVGLGAYLLWRYLA
ncbi:MAG: hypothetical protein KJO40_13545 [Deltaproteobacteria bacterium]|nr:hypothetical protein [Deltaproteobacteria bacterium]